MVQIQVKYAAEKEFIYECESSSRIEDITKHIIEISNLQLQIQNLALQLLNRLSPLLHTHPNQTIPLHRALCEAQSYASKEQIVHNKAISVHVLRDHLRSIEKEFRASSLAVDFSDSNFEQLLLTDIASLQENAAADIAPLQENAAELWWAGKKLMKGKNLSDYIGKNEKTKITLKLLSPA